VFIATDDSAGARTACMGWIAWCTAVISIRNGEFDTLSRRLLESKRQVQDWIRSLARMGKPD
jgi:hypothetical protein